MKIERTKTLTGHHYVATLNDRRIQIDGAATAKEAKEKLETYLGQLEEHYITVRYLWCQDGTVLVVRWYGNGWGYDITSSTRKAHHSSVMTNHTDLQAILQDARNHAEQSYGGLVNHQR